MKKRVLSLALACAACLTLLAGCGSDNNTSDTVTLKVGASPAPHAEILELIVDDLAEQGITLEIVEYNDYIVPNEAVESGENDANYFQHITYMNNFNAEHGTHLVSVAEVHYEPFGIYGRPGVQPGRAARRRGHRHPQRPHQRRPGAAAAPGAGPHHPA